MLVHAGRSDPGLKTVMFATSIFGVSFFGNVGAVLTVRSAVLCLLASRIGLFGLVLSIQNRPHRNVGWSSLVWVG